MWLVIWCCRDLLFECVKQQNRGFRVITVLQFGKSHHALLPFLWGVFEFLSCFVVFVHSHKMTNAWWVLVSFGFFCCVCWDILRVVNILLYPALPPLFFSSSLPLFLFLCLSFFLSLSLSTPSAHTSIWLQPSYKSTWTTQAWSKLGYEKETCKQ